MRGAEIPNRWPGRCLVGVLAIVGVVTGWGDPLRGEERSPVASSGAGPILGFVDSRVLKLVPESAPASGPVGVDQRREAELRFALEETAAAVGATILLDAAHLMPEGTVPVDQGMLARNLHVSMGRGRIPGRAGKAWLEEARNYWRNQGFVDSPIPVGALDLRERAAQTLFQRIGSGR